jgi:hypothetical protein
VMFRDVTLIQDLGWGGNLMKPRGGRKGVKGEEGVILFNVQ